MKKIAVIFMLFCWTFVSANDIFTDSIYKATSKIKKSKTRIDRLNNETEKMWLLGEYDRGLLFAEEALLQSKKYDYKKGKADAIINKGVIFDYKGKYSEAIYLYLKALKIQLKINDREGISKNYINLGLVYQNQGNNKKALHYYVKSLEINKKEKNLNGISAAINNIGIIYMNEKKYTQALDNYLYCLEVDRKLKDSIAMSDTYNNIGLIYLDQKKYDEAKSYFFKSYDIRKRMGNYNGICNSYLNLADLEFDSKNYSTAKAYYLKALLIAEKLGIYQTMQVIYTKLSNIAYFEKDITSEFKFYKLSIAYRDSISNEENIKKQTQDEMQYEFDQKVAEDKLKEHKRELITKHEKHKQRVIIFAVTVIALIMLIFSFFLFKRLKIEKNQKIIIEEQKNLVEDKNKMVELKNQEILDSITYAKRIQSAILPPERLVKEYLLNSFVLYKPKDIVAGDFYWIEPIGDLIIFAVADCTGHGVPGAMVSVVCHNALNRSVREYGLTIPGEILDKTREIIVSEFDKNDENVSDGMDISLCSLNLKTMTLQWAGANSPLWIIKKQDESIIEISPNKQPIGKHISYKSFQTQSIEIEKGDSIYLFTDGYIDQFGGNDGKKFKSKNMRELIKEIHNEPMNIQRIKFDETFEKWKGDFDQVDDVCVIGIQL